MHSREISGPGCQYPLASGTSGNAGSVLLTAWSMVSEKFLLSPLVLCLCDGVDASQCFLGPKKVASNLF